MRIYDESGELIEMAEEVGSNEETYVDASYSYYFYIEVYPYNEGEFSNFSLTTSFQGYSNPENVTVPDDAPVVRDGRDYHEWVESEDGMWFKYTATRSGLLAIYLTGEGADLDLAVYDAEGNHLRTSDEYEAYESVLLPLERGETYFIWIYPYELEGEAIPFTLWTDAMREREIQDNPETR